MSELESEDNNIKSGLPSGGEMNMSELSNDGLSNDNNANTLPSDTAAGQDIISNIVTEQKFTTTITANNQEEDSNGPIINDDTSTDAMDDMFNMSEEDMAPLALSPDSCDASIPYSETPASPLKFDDTDEDLILKYDEDDDTAKSNDSSDNEKEKKDIFPATKMEIDVDGDIETVEFTEKNMLEISSAKNMLLEQGDTLANTSAMDVDESSMDITAESTESKEKTVLDTDEVVKPDIFENKNTVPDSTEISKQAENKKHIVQQNIQSNIDVVVDKAVNIMSEDVVASLSASQTHECVTEKINTNRPTDFPADITSSERNALLDADNLIEPDISDNKDSLVDSSEISDQADNATHIAQDNIHTSVTSEEKVTSLTASQFKETNNENSTKMAEVQNTSTRENKVSDISSTTLSKMERNKQSLPMESTDKEPLTSEGILKTEMDPDASDEIPEVVDSLGLLAESSRSLDYEYNEDEDDERDPDDEEFDDQDDESNEMTVEHSEDSNPQTADAVEEKIKQQPSPKTSADSECDAEHPLETGVAEETKLTEDLLEKKMNAVEVPEMNEGIESSANKSAEIPVKLPDVAEDDKMDISDDVSIPDMKVGEQEVVPEVVPVAVKEATNQVPSPETSAASSPDLVSGSDKANKKLGLLKLSNKLEIDCKNDIMTVSFIPEASTSSANVMTAPISPAEMKLEDTTKKACLHSAVMSIVELDSDDDADQDKEAKNSGVDDGNKPKEENVTTDGGVQPEKTDINTSPPKSTTDAAISKPKQEAKLSPEVFNLDSDEDTEQVVAEKDAATQPAKKLSLTEMQKIRENNKCLNYMCPSMNSGSVWYSPAPQFVVSYFGVKKKKKTIHYVCQVCLSTVSVRMEQLMKGVKDMKPLLELEMDKQSQELVEISDSDSDSENEDIICVPEQNITGDHIRFLEEMNFGDLINDTWEKYNLDERLKSSKEDLEEQIKQIQKDSEEIDAIFKECQIVTDKLRSDLYATFAVERQELEPIEIIDPDYFPFLIASTPSAVSSSDTDMSEIDQTRRSKRMKMNISDTPSNADSIQQSQMTAGDVSYLNEKLDDDNSDISVVKLSAESAPADLPPPGELVRVPFKNGDQVFAMRQLNTSWVKAKITECIPKGSVPGGSSFFSGYKVRLDNKSKVKGSSIRMLNGKQVAYAEPSNVRLTIGTRVIALFKEVINVVKRESYYSGIVAEIPNPVNNYRYLVFFDDGYAQYVTHTDTRVVGESSQRVWEDVHPESRDFVRNYLVAYPERPMVRLHAGQSLKTEWNGKWWISKVLKVDASLAQVYFEADDRTEWIYRGSTRLLPLFLELQAAERHRPRGLTRANKSQISKQNMPYVEYTRNEEQSNKSETQQQQQQHEEQKKQRAVAKKSTSSQAQLPLPSSSSDNVMSRVVYYTPKAAVKPLKMVPHACSSRCRRYDVLPLKELRTYNPLAKPLLSGWERQSLRFKGRRVVMYRSPCGRRLRNMPELHRYLRVTQSELSVDLFDFNPNTHCLAEFVLNRCNVSKKDLSHGKENVPVPCVNYYDSSLPEFCSYNTERTPTAGVPLNLDPEFLCGCDCTDDCQDKSKCACWRMTLAGARTIGMEGEDLGYVYKRLLDPLPSGIFECNSRCKCSSTCLNRVVQHPLQLKLQVFKTLKRGWGIRALNDVPKGAFLCVYVGNLLTDATANLDGLNEGDEYLAELDYIEVVEQMKEGYESDVPDKDKEEPESASDDEIEDEKSSDEEAATKYEMDDDFRPTPWQEASDREDFKKRLRKREWREKKNLKQEIRKREVAAPGASVKKEREKESNVEGDCITISDDEEVREPSRFTVQAGMDDKEFTPKHRSVRSYFGKDEACYIMDAKVQGNIGRYLNHSCSPNVFVQNVFVDTHDPRFPWVAFFARAYVRAGTELTWNYNYDVGSVPGKVMYCYCSAPNCRGRLL